MDLPPDTQTKVDSINLFLHTVEGDYFSLSNVRPSEAEQIRNFLSEADLEIANTRFTYDSEFQQIRISKCNAMICTTADWLQGEERRWKERKILPDAYENDITTFGRVEYHNFAEPHILTYKTPIYCMSPWSSKYPSVVVETGYTEPVTDLEHDKNIWKIATEGQTKVIFVTKFLKTPRNTISGFISILRVNGVGGTCTCAKYTIFPEPSPPTDQSYHISLGEVYGGRKSPGVDSDTILELRIAKLRDICRHALKISGLTPDK